MCTNEASAYSILTVWSCDQDRVFWLRANIKEGEHKICYKQYYSLSGIKWYQPISTISFKLQQDINRYQIIRTNTFPTLALAAVMLPVVPVCMVTYVISPPLVYTLMPPVCPLY